MTAILATIKVRGDTAANWTSVNPILAAKEIGLETNTRKIKFGDGTTAWNSLAYATAGAPDPVRPAFSAELNAVASNVTGDGTLHTIVFDSVLGDQGGNYNASNGRFTAPVAGYYHFSVRAMFADAGSASFTFASLRLIVGGATHYLDYRGNTEAFEPATNAFIMMRGSITLPMAAGDTAEAAVAVDGGSRVIDVYNKPYTSFSGHQIS